MASERSGFEGADTTTSRLGRNGPRIGRAGKPSANSGASWLAEGNAWDDAGSWSTGGGRNSGNQDSRSGYRGSGGANRQGSYWDDASDYTQNNGRTSGGKNGNYQGQHEVAWNEGKWGAGYGEEVRSYGKAKSGGNVGYSDNPGDRFAGQNGSHNGSYNGSYSGNQNGRDQKGGGDAERANPFGAAGPATATGVNRPFGAAAGGRSDGNAAVNVAERPKYVPPAMRGVGAAATAADESSYRGNSKFGHEAHQNSASGGGKGGKAEMNTKGSRGSYEHAVGRSRENNSHVYADEAHYSETHGDSKGSKSGKATAAKGEKAGKGSHVYADEAHYSETHGGSKGSKSGKATAAKGEKAGKGGRSAKGSSSKMDKTWADDEEWEEPASTPAAKPKSRSGGTGVVSSSHLSEQRFSDLQVSKETKRAMSEGFGYEFMTTVQAASIGPLLDGRDVVARARTGTGKTLAFLVPIVERLRTCPGGVGGGISALVLSPTRELAQQIHDEATVLLEYHRRLGAVCFYGGTKMTRDHRDLSQRSCDILVATPGRMQDHLDSTAGFSSRIQELVFLTLDEADQLLDQGFRDAILKILSYLPGARQRQGALFSATFPAGVSEISRMALKPDHVWLNTVTDEITPDQIAQSVASTDIEGMTELLWSALSSEMGREPKSYKIMVFFVAARVCQLYSEMFSGAGVQVLEIHSRKSQPHRTKASEQFRTCQRGIVFSSDVVARGMDFPDVTTVIQVGLPSSRDQYIHRLGRTGRAGKSGGCILLLHDFEQHFLRTISDLPVKWLPTEPFPNAKTAPDALWRPPDSKTGCQAYQAWLGYYNSAKGLGWKKDRLVNEAYRFAESISAITDDGLPPPITKKVVGNMGLKGTPGLNLVSQLPYGDS